MLNIKSDLYNLRSATEDDCSFLFHLLTMTMKQYYEQTYGGWDDTIEYSYFLDSFRDNDYQIISYKRHDAGCLSIKHDSTGIFINEIQILPEYQNIGIGSMILNSIIEESEKTNTPIKLEVLKSNTKALTFYYRMDFKISGDNKTHFIMMREPVSHN